MGLMSVSQVTDDHIKFWPRLWGENKMDVLNVVFSVEGDDNKSRGVNQTFYFLYTERPWK